MAPTCPSRAVSFLFESLSAEWISASTTSYGNPGTFHVRIYESSFAVIDVRADATDGDKIVDRMSKQPGGMDFWNMQAPKAIVYLDDNGNARGTVRVDASNRLANLPAEQAGNYKEVRPDHRRRWSQAVPQVAHSRRRYRVRDVSSGLLTTKTP